MKVPVAHLLVLLIITLTLAGCGIGTNDTNSLTLELQGEGTILPVVGSKQFETGTALDITAKPASGWSFSHWEGEVAEPHFPQTTVVVDQDKKITAIFTKRTEPNVKTAPGGHINYRSDGSRVSSRPRGAADIEYIMIHAISDAAQNPTNPYRLERISQIFRDYSVEAHYVIDRDGDIYQYVSDHNVARHAGVGSWDYDPRLTNNMNRYAVGIEVMGIGTPAEMTGVIGNDANSNVREEDRGYTASQYAALHQLTNNLKQQYQVPTENIIGHHEYDPGRKWDPGELFEWSMVR